MSAKLQRFFTEKLSRIQERAGILYSSIKGFTLIELIIVIAIVTTLLSFVFISISRPEQTSSLDGALQSVLSDIKSQQIKAMTSVVDEGTESLPYGVYFNQNSYVLYKGAIYNPNDSDNFTVTLNQNLRFQNSSFPNSTLVFSPLSGEVQGVGLDGVSITLLHNVSHVEKVLHVNRYGVIYEVD